MAQSEYSSKSAVFLWLNTQNVLIWTQIFENILRVYANLGMHLYACVCVLTAVAVTQLQIIISISVFSTLWWEAFSHIRRIYTLSSIISFISSAFKTIVKEVVDMFITCGDGLSVAYIYPNSSNCIYWIWEVFKIYELYLNNTVKKQSNIFSL